MSPPSPGSTDDVVVVDGVNVNDGVDADDDSCGVDADDDSCGVDADDESCGVDADDESCGVDDDADKDATVVVEMLELYVELESADDVTSEVCDKYWVVESPEETWVVESPEGTV